jgi:putative peptidoglycan lipid II flippase
VAREGNRHALLVGVGIFVSRIFGLVRATVFSRYFGTSAAADAFTAAFKIPNLLNNLFGEGVLSASFIPVYARLLAEKDEEEAGRVAGAVAGLLSLTVSVLVLLGVLATPYFIDLIAPGFEGEKRELTIRLVRILFFSAGLMTLSAWCLGILNSHRKFLLSYSAPVIWNLAMIATLVAFGGRRDLSTLAVDLAWGSVAGAALMFLAQLPAVLSIAPRLRWGMSGHVRTVTRNFAPVFVSRGVVQISAYVDSILASLLPEGAVAALGYAQNLYVLPVSLFGMSVSAAELPEMSSALGDHGYLNQRLNAGLRQIAFLIVPSAMAFLALGDVVTAVVLQGGRFTHADSRYVWGILAGSAVGLLAQTMGRLYSSTYYALRDTRTPLYFAIARVVLTTGLGYLFAFPLPKLIGIDPAWGVAGLTASAGIAGWVEFTLLRRSMNRRIGSTGLPANLAARLWASAAMAAAAGWAVKIELGMRHPRVYGIAILAVYGVAYFGLTYAMGIEECRQIVRRFVRRNPSVR